MAHLVTGHAGIEHIKPSDDGAFNIGIFGNGQYVFPIGEQFGYEIISNNLIKIKSGELVNQGRHINIPVNNYEEVIIENGLQGVKRHDIIVMRYENNPDTSIESASVVVLKGTSSANPSDPSMSIGNIYEGANVSDMPLYRVYLDGLNIEKVECMFTMMPSLPAVNAKAEQNAKDIETINSNLRWEYVGDATGSTSLSLPSEYNELYVECAISGGSGTVNFQIPKIALSSTTKAYSGGRYDSAASFVSVAISINTTSVSLAVVKGNMGDNLSDSVLKVWYR